MYSIVYIDMPQIQYIHNTVAAISFKLAPGQFSYQITGMPSQNPDEAVIRVINWNGAANDSNLYLVWCNLINSIIASFSGGNIAPICPQTRIWLNSFVPNTIEFKILSPTSTGDTVFISDMSGDLAIHIDFIKYKNTHIHA